MDNYTKKPAVKFHRGAVFYALLLLFGLIFTQALRSTASSVLFWFLILLPILSVIYVLIGKLIIRIYVGSDFTKVEKLAPVEYEMRIINASPIAYPFVEAIISVPQPDGVRCTEQSMTMNLPPLGSYIVNHTTSFKYRGTYEIGVKCLYISDFLHLFSIRLDVDIYNNVLVYPRRLGMEMKLATSATDIPNDSAKVVFSTEKAEISNIREYIPGDSLKSIHWKLSSKTPTTLMVKEFNTNTSRNVYMLCDLSRAIPPEVFEDEEYAAAKAKAEKEQAKKAKKDRRVKLKPSKEEKEAMAAERLVKKQDRKQDKRLKGGMSASAASDAAMVDELIRSTADSKLAPREEKKPLFGGKKKNAPADTRDPETIAAEAAEAERKRKNDETKAQLAIGGTVKPQYAADMDEYCADGVVEMTIAATLNELRNGNTVTLIWFDSRSDTGIAMCELSCPEDFEHVYSSISTAPASPENLSVTNLLMLIGESLNVTIRICTSNLDPMALTNYSTIPGLFGGAGTGCVAEILLFNPEERYEDRKIRREYVELCRLRLAQDGVDLTELTAVKDENGNISMRKVSDH